MVDVNTKAQSSNTLWNDNAQAVKSQTNIMWNNEKMNKSSGLRNSQVDFELNSPSNFFNGQPITNGYYSYRINPTTHSEFAYLNRNKLVNRRIALKKQSDYSYGLPSIGKSPDNITPKNNQKVFSEFALGSENLLNEAKELDNLIENVETTDGFGYYKNISSQVLPNGHPKSGKVKKHEPKSIKTSPIIILEREK